tara:strand:- start:115 stop:318 length:204 start_codon:yes stop_codon:yes gene_type:complete
MNNTFRTTAYNAQGQRRETETSFDSWEATEICLAMSEQYGYAETLDAWGKHCGEYGNRPVSLGQRDY